jgi:isoamylase
MRQSRRRSALRAKQDPASRRPATRISPLAGPQRLLCLGEREPVSPLISCPRARQRRNLLATLLLSDGVPLLVGGDELGRTQRGNNNAYCQDNEISWVAWEHADDDLATFVAELCALRREHPLLRRERFFAPGEITWLRPDGAPMEAGDWQNPNARAIAALVHPGRSS